MELQGELSDFPLADILQIICLSKKTGTLIITSQERKGMIVFVRGKVVQAITDASPGSLGDVLIERQLIGPYELEQALKMQHRTSPPRLLGSLLVELGYVDRIALNQSIREQIQHAVAGLVGLRRGSFELKLNVVPIGRTTPYPGQDFVLTEGLDVDEMLLEVAAAMDEAQREVTTTTRGATGLLTQLPAALAYAGVDPVGDFTPTLEGGELDEDPEFLLARLDPSVAAERPSSDLAAPSEHDRFVRLQALLGELKGLTSHGEVALIILRYASEVASRGVLFVIREKEIVGQGQFGVRCEGKSADARVREIRLPRNEPSFLNEVAVAAHTRLGRLEKTGANRNILDKIGGMDCDLMAVAIPMVCEQRVRIILYLDNFPGDREFRGLPELELLVDQAGVVMEKILLEQRLQEIELRLEEERERPSPVRG
jgi:hypothetical protein